MEIGLKSARSLGADILGTGMMAARFHCCGVVEVAMDTMELNNTVPLLESLKKCVASLRDQFN